MESPSGASTVPRPTVGLTLLVSKSNVFRAHDVTAVAGHEDKSNPATRPILNLHLHRHRILETPT